MFPKIEFNAHLTILVRCIRIRASQNPNLKLKIEIRIKPKNRPRSFFGGKTSDFIRNGNLVSFHLFSTGKIVSSHNFEITKFEIIKKKLTSTIKFPISPDSKSQVNPREPEIVIRMV